MFTVLIKLFLILGLWIVAFIPLELFLAVRYFLEPNGFWQNLIILGLGAYVLGAMQVVFIIVGIGLSFAIAMAE